MVSLKGSYTVAPAQQTPSGRMQLSEWDQINAITHSPTVYFYRPTDSELFASALDILRDSLSKVLVIFYPLAGRLHWIGGDRLELDCNAMGAQLLEAVSEAKIDDFGDFRPTPEIRALIPSVDYNNTPIHEQPLLIVQLTRFSCGGISLGLGLSHIIAGGESALHFVAEWAKIARGEPSDNLPFLDRTILQAEEPLALPPFDDAEFSPLPLLIGQSDSKEERKKETIVAMLKLSKEQIEKLKNKANEGRPSDSGGRAYSKYEAVAGHMWRCACKARRHKKQQLTILQIAVDFRNRTNPPLPHGYFGNTMFRAGASTSSGELLSKPLGYASSKIREAVEKVTDEYLRSSLVFIRSQTDLSMFRISHVVGSTQGTFFGNPNMGITSWGRLPIYGADFGWGKEIHMGPGALGYDGKSFILPGPDEDGSFIIPLSLQVAHMDDFTKFFYEDIQGLGLISR